MSGAGRRPPRLELVVEIESSSVRVNVVCDSHEDEQALLRWLRRRPRVIASLADVEALLDRLGRAA